MNGFYFDFNKFYGFSSVFGDMFVTLVLFVGFSVDKVVHISSISIFSLVVGIRHPSIPSHKLSVLSNRICLLFFHLCPYLYVQVSETEVFWCRT